MRLPSVRLFVTFVILVLSAAHGLAARTLAGRVVDPDDRPVVAARVLVSAGGRPLEWVLTDRDGRFAVTAPEVELVTLRVAAEGFRAEALDVDLRASGDDLGTIRLAIGALSESVVVSATQVEVPLTEATSSVTVITAGELQSRQLHTVGDALRAVPGLTVAAAGGTGTTTGLFPRGGESNYTLVLIDGIPANAFGGDFDFGHLSTANVERIEIVRGPQSALFGSNAIGGVIRVVTRKGGPPSARLHAEAGGDGSSRVAGAASGASGPFEWGASYEQLQSDGLNGDVTAGGLTVDNDDYARRSGQLSLALRRNGAWVRGELHAGRDERGFPGPFGSNPVGAYEAIDVTSRGKNDRSLASLSFTVPWRSRARVQGHVAHARLESDFASPFGASDSFSRRWSGRAQADLDLAGGAAASAGLELQRERAGSTFVTGAREQRIPVNRTIAGYFGELRWNRREALFLTAGLRVESIDRDPLEPSGDPFSPRPALPEDRVVSANPRVSAAWLARSAPHAFTKIRAAFATGIRPPDAFELAFTDNPALRPERSVSGEAGVDHTFAGGRGLIEATAFTNRYDDLIVSVGSFSGSSRYQSDNISNARARGLELAVSLRGRVNARGPVDVTGRIGYTLLHTKILAVDRDASAPPPFEVGDALLRRPRHQFFADLSARTGALSLFVRGGGRGASLDVEPSLGTFGGLFRAPGYSTWTVGGAWRLAGSAELVARVENAFDTRYEESFGFPAAGRRAFIGVGLAAGR